MDLLWDGSIWGLQHILPEMEPAKEKAILLVALTPERIGHDDWPTLVVEAGYTQSMESLRKKMAWWFDHSNHQVQIVILAKLNHRRREIVLEKYTESLPVPRPGATSTRRSTAAALQFICRQEIRVRKDPASNPPSYSVVPEGAALVLEFQLLFLRPADPYCGERDIRVEVPALQTWARHVWAGL